MPASTIWRERALTAAGVTLAAVVLFIGYFRMARGVGTNADGAGNALQAWDILHGNLFLHGWTLSDVSFYTVELLQLVVIEAIVGLRPDALIANAALSYTLLVLLVAAVAKGRSRGRLAAARIALSLSFVMVPQAGLGHAILLNQPDHVGTLVPLLVTWLVLDRATVNADGSAREPGRWVPVAIGALLVWGEVSDPLVLLAGAGPLVLIGLMRLVRGRRWRPRQWRCFDGAIVLAGAGSVLLSRGLVTLIQHTGGYTTQKVPTELAPFGTLGRHLTTTRDGIAVLFGAYFPDLHGWVQRTLGVVHVLGLALLVGAIVVVIIRSVRGWTDRLSEILVIAFAVNIAAFLFSALNSDTLAAREIAPVMLAAVLATRVWLPARTRPVAARATAPPAATSTVPTSTVPMARVRQSRAGRGLLAGALVAVAALFAAAFVDLARAPSIPPDSSAIADWLASQDLHYGIGSYWTASAITLDSHGAVAVRPLTGPTTIKAYAWESRASWYDPGRHDARFVVVDLFAPKFGTVAGAIAQFGQPVRQVTLPSSAGRHATVLIYDHNLLVGLPAWCTADRSAASMQAC